MVFDRRFQEPARRYERGNPIAFVQDQIKGFGTSTHVKKNYFFLRYFP